MKVTTKYGWVYPISFECFTYKKEFAKWVKILLYLDNQSASKKELVSNAWGKDIINYHDCFTALVRAKMISYDRKTNKYSLLPLGKIKLKKFHSFIQNS